MSAPVITVDIQVLSPLRLNAGQTKMIATTTDT